MILTHNNVVFLAKTPELSLVDSGSDIVCQALRMVHLSPTGQQGQMGVAFIAPGAPLFNDDEWKSYVFPSKQIMRAKLAPKEMADAYLAALSNLIAPPASSLLRG